MPNGNHQTKPRHEAAASPTDDGLLKSIRARMQTGYSAVKVSVADGFVTLEGSVRSFRSKELLHSFVMGLRGVRALKDLLKVDPTESIQDQAVALHVRQALDAHAELPFGTASVAVENGVVTLKGYVRSLEERFLVENVASHCRGVVQAINDLTVDPLEEVSDEAAARAVKGALEYSEEFETEGVTVSCTNGRICLRGEVPTLMDRSLCEELARIQGGVRSVSNLIVVKAAEEKSA